MYGNPMKAGHSENPMVKDGQQMQPNPPHEVEDEYVKLANHIGNHGFEGVPQPECPDKYTAFADGSSKQFQGKVEGVSSEQSYYGTWQSGGSSESNSSLPEQHVKDADTD